MADDYVYIKEISSFCDLQKKIFKQLNIPGDYNRGVIDGITIVEQWFDKTKKGGDLDDSI